MVSKNNSDRSGEVFDDEIGLCPELFVITIIEENGAAAGGVATVNVPPAIADHPATREIQAKAGCGGVQHGRFGFPALAGLAMVCAAVITNLDQVDLRH